MKYLHYDNHEYECTDEPCATLQLAMHLAENEPGNSAADYLVSALLKIQNGSAMIIG